MEIGIFVAGRLGSKRLPKKLILPFGESNLWDIACKKLNHLPDEYEKVVLINEPELINIAEKYENIRIILRSKTSSIGNAEDASVYEDVDKMKSDYIMWINPCLSMVQTATIEGALDYYKQSDKRYLESVKSFKSWLFNSEGKLITDTDFNKLNTKSVNGIYEAAHAFRIFPKKEFLKTWKMLGTDLLIYPISSLESMDVDTELDYTIALECYKKYTGKT